MELNQNRGMNFDVRVDTRELELKIELAQQKADRILETLQEAKRIARELTAYPHFKPSILIRSLEDAGNKPQDIFKRQFEILAEKSERLAKMSDTEKNCAN